MSWNKRSNYNNVHGETIKITLRIFILCLIACALASISLKTGSQLYVDPVVH